MSQDIDAQGIIDNLGQQIGRLAADNAILTSMNENLKKKVQEKEKAE